MGCSKVWFRSFLDDLTPALLLNAVCCNEKLDIPLCSTSLHPDYLLEKVTLAELKQQLKLKQALKIAKNRSAQKCADTERQAEEGLFMRARELLLHHYRALVKVLCLVVSFHCALS